MNWKNNLMKTFYRLSQSQRLYGAVAGTLVIGALYYENIPVVSQWGLWGKIVLAIAVLILFISFGYIYDKKLKLWEHDYVVNADRNPYTFDLLTPKEILKLQIDLTQLESTKKIQEKLGIEDESLDEEIQKVKKWIKEGRVNGKPRN